ncbi:HAD-IC family P-type ATPase [Natroniella sp. ANB-PHB2]|uniref:cation-translocating P-type ATPase n=1 Tax=Natroniella sp. ANB-PHB2 TaxID=3384444 RepID=UPI0038D47DDF
MTQQPNIVSYLPGRIRFKIKEIKNNNSLARKIKQLLLKFNSIKCITTNIYSKSILIYYQPNQISAKTIVKKLSYLLTKYKNLKENRVINRVTPTLKQNSVEIPKFSKQSPQQKEWYKLTSQQIIKTLSSDPKQGLKEKQAQQIIEKLGPNQFNQKKKRSFWQLFLDQFKDFIIKLLLGASLTSFLLGQVSDALIILAITILEALLGSWQEFKAKKSLTSLKKYSETETKVIRNNITTKINSKKLVPGDIISLEAGDIIPADARLIDSSKLKVNEATLTGESEAISKTHKVEYTSTKPLADRNNMIFMGTSIVKGRAKAIVVATGNHTQMGYISQKVNTSKQQSTPLEKDLHQLAKHITWACLATCSGIIFTGFLTGQPLVQMIKTGLGLAIGAIPEGLATILTISLAFGVKKIAERGAIVKQLSATENLSCTDIICTDKTGTLTTGQMTVTEVQTINHKYKVSGRGYSTIGKFYCNQQLINPQKRQDLKQLLTIASLCNNTSYEKNSESLKVIGDPTEGALLVLAHKANLDLTDFDCYTRKDEIPFDSETKKMTVICQDGSGNYSINVKGAPDIILAKCSNIFDGKQIRKLTKEDTEKINTQIKEMGNKALRVMGFACKKLDYKPTTDHMIEEGLTFIGLTGMIDPPRSKVKDAIKQCRQAGIKVIMITGDHKRTAKAIGKKLNLFDPTKNEQVLTGQQLNNLSKQQLTEKIDRISIFARTSPQQKLRIVKVLKEKGHVVTMTGDGVNDAPAIKEADIGIAMGQSGTDIAQEASSIVLTDDNFTTIVDAIKEGRSISSNIKRFLKYVLAGNIGEAIAIFISAILGLPPPLIASQLLLINFITEGFPALSLGIEPADHNNMKKPPRDGQQSILDRNLLSQILFKGSLLGASTAGLYLTNYFTTGNLTKASTLAYANLVITQMVHVFQCRNKPIRANRYIVPAVIISCLLLLSSIYLPPLMQLFGTVPLQLFDWIIILSISSLISLINYTPQKKLTQSTPTC